MLAKHDTCNFFPSTSFDRAKLDSKLAILRIAINLGVLCLRFVLRFTAWLSRALEYAFLHVYLWAIRGIGQSEAFAIKVRRELLEAELK